MISFRRKENKVLVDVEHGIFGSDEYFALEINQAQDYQAELLRKALQENLNNHLADLKSKYYKLGWADAKAKRQKRSGFWGGWTS